MSSESLPLAVSGAWCATAAGEGAKTAFGTLSERIGATRPYPGTLSVDGESILCVPSEHIAEELAPQERVAGLLGAACADISRAAQETPFSGRGEMVLALAPADKQRRRYLDDGVLRQLLTEELELDASTPVSIWNAEEGVIQLINEAGKRLASGNCDWVLLGAVDSLLDPLTVKTLASEERLAVKGVPGLMPGEACAFVLLRQLQEGERGVVVLSPGVVKSESKNGRADQSKMEGLSAAIAGAASVAGIRANQIERVALDIPASHTGEMEWLQTTQRLWPSRVPERYRQAISVGVIEPPDLEGGAPELVRTSDIFGDVGVASIPLQLCLVVEWFKCSKSWSAFGLDDFGSHWVLCEADGERRGALCLTAV